MPDNCVSAVTSLHLRNFDVAIIMRVIRGQTLARVIRGQTLAIDFRGHRKLEIQTTFISAQTLNLQAEACVTL